MGIKDVSKTKEKVNIKTPAFFGFGWFRGSGRQIMISSVCSGVLNAAERNKASPRPGGGTALLHKGSGKLFFEVSGPLVKELTGCFE